MSFVVCGFVCARLRSFSFVCLQLFLGCFSFSSRSDHLSTPQATGTHVQHQAGHASEGGGRTFLMAHGRQPVTFSERWMRNLFAAHGHNGLSEQEMVMLLRQHGIVVVGTTTLCLFLS